LLKVEKLSVSYGGIKALSDVSIEVNKGQLVAVIGANGAGKTTLVRAIMGLAKIEAGTITLRDEDITQLPAWKRATKGIAIVPEGGRPFPYLSVLSNLMIGAYTIKDKRVVRDNLHRTFDLFPILKERANQFARTLSGGEAQMLAIGRGIMSNPSLLLMDEPSMGLSPVLIDTVFKKIEEMKREGTTILLAEQNARKALEVADACCVLELGHISLRGSPEQLAGNAEVKKAYLAG
jgi:branched-chain amino acid transport system ATP-binding protein